MPISSRRCGMISALKIRLMCNFPTSTPQLSQILAKREAERLCKSFLADSPPPKLPDDFEFVVAHKCGWGCRGSFLPSRYNSSRAKCLRCHTCDQFFSPNKFIFHSHRTNDSTYVQPDAANFNSWRRHLHLVEPNIPEGQLHAWEDVKAMFNGGSRKRVGGDTSSAGAGHRQSTQKFDGSRGKRPSGPVGLPIRPSGPPWGEVTPGSFAHLNNVIESAMANPFCWGFPPPPSLLLQPHHKVLSVPQQLYTEDQISDMTAAPSAFRPVELSLDLSVKKTTGRAGAARQVVKSTVSEMQIPLTCPFWF